MEEENINVENKQRKMRLSYVKDGILEMTRHDKTIIENSHKKPDDERSGAELAPERLHFSGEVGPNKNSFLTSNLLSAEGPRAIDVRRFSVPPRLHLLRAERIIYHSSITVYISHRTML